MSTLGKNIRALRTMKGISQTELAKVLDLQRSTVTKWETGAILSIRASHLDDLCAHYGLSKDDILSSDAGLAAQLAAANGEVDHSRSAGFVPLYELEYDDYLEFNEWGTSFEMFDMADGDEDGDGVADGTDAYTVGYLRSFNAIAFGHLMAIRVTWREGDTAENPIVRHVSTYKVPEDNSKLPGMSGGDRPIVKLQELQSSMKYIYNLELRRGTLAVIRTAVIPWEQKDALVYDQKGTIQ